MSTQTETISLEIVTPVGVAFKGDVFQVDIPGSEGIFGVLPKHSPLIATLTDGTLIINPRSSTEEKIFISGGFAEISDNKCVILTPYFVNLKNIDKSQIEHDFYAVEKELAITLDTSEKEKLKVKHKRLGALLKA